MGTFLPLSKSLSSTALHVSEALLLAFGLLLVIGLIGELAKSPKWSAHLRKFELLVIIGVAGELIADGGIFVFSERLQAISDSEVTALAQKAADTRERAAKLEKETVVLREQLRTQGSRAALLMETHSQELFAKLEPFRGQKVDVGQCGRSDNEVTLTVVTLMLLLRARVWDVNLFNPFFACTTGMQVIIRHNAPEPTRAAASALSTVLIELGLISRDRQPYTQLPAPKKSETLGWNPSGADAVLLLVQIHP
jgi:hypothetical protein